ncbi:MAG: DUF4238 domain-containing protein [Aquincola sp.]|nr:DUF4238 domain-containing protein [Aquincola sp.]
MSSPKRHHYLPQFYLNAFCRDGGLWVFDRERSEYRQQTPNNTALKQHYYSVEFSNGEKDTRIEEMLSLVESRAKSVLEKLTSGAEITNEERDEFALFTAFMMNRGPVFEKSVNAMQESLIRQIGDLMFADEERTNQVMKDRERDTGEKPEVSAKELVDFYKRGAFKIKAHRNESLKMMLPLSLELANCFRQMNWGVFFAPPKTAFVTTDAPFVLLPPEDWKPSLFGYGVITRGAKKLLPLSAYACFVMFDHGKDLFHRSIDAAAVRQINLIIARHCDRFLIARDEAHLRSVVRASGMESLKPTRLFSRA